VRAKPNAFRPADLERLERLAPVLAVAVSLGRRVATLERRLKQTTRAAPVEILGKSAAVKRLKDLIRRAGPTPATVLVTGETGSGKELVALSLHAQSTTADGPFVAINCAAIPETLLETELFGYEKGAFTGAAGRKPGKFELAHRGTLFLDEIGDMPLSLQPKILRALEEKSFERVGGTALLHVDVRVVAATNKHLKAAVAARQFREDLYFRLSVFPITIPPLRERLDDITMLAKHFIERFSKDLNKKALALADSAVDELRAYPWPGNVRELQNCIERAVILTDGDTIHARHLNLTFPRDTAPAPGAADGPWSQIDLSGTLLEASRRVVAEVERRKIEQTLKDTGDRTRAAETLQISYKVLLAKMKEYRLSMS
jgi:transcriptional regulator with PAS, ATPase and Fis domain